MQKPVRKPALDIATIDDDQGSHDENDENDDNDNNYNNHNNDSDNNDNNNNNAKLQQAMQDCSRCWMIDDNECDEWTKGMTAVDDRR